MNVSSLLNNAVNHEKGWITYLYAVMGILLIIFPEQFTSAIPYMLGLGLIIRGLISCFAVYKYKREASVKAGWIIIDLVLGCAILYHNANAIGAIGAIWAMLSLYEAANEITESYINKSYSVIGIITSIISIALAVLLMFNPFQHFAFHVRVLGLEMLSSVLSNRINAHRAG